MPRTSARPTGTSPSSSSTPSPDPTGPRLVTVGHGTLPAGDFADLLTAAGVSHLVDVRSYPGSRRHPHFGRDAMGFWLPEAGVAYSWEPRLGGRRKPEADSPHHALRSDQFRGYADHQASEEFRAAVDDLLDGAEAESGTLAVMCAESVWWRCHRMLLADVIVLLHGVEVDHLFHDGRRAPHRPSPAARVDGDRLIYDVGATPPLDGAPTRPPAASP